MAAEPAKRAARYKVPLSINFLAILRRFPKMPAMNVARKSGSPTELRRDRRYGLPAVEIVIGDERFRAINWSMRGALLYGICDAVGARVRGEMGMPGTSDGVPFAATVVRSDLNTGNSAICFEDCRTERIEFHDHACAAPVQ
jgi:hypothetical protein